MYVFMYAMHVWMDDMCVGFECMYNMLCYDMICLYVVLRMHDMYVCYVYMYIICVLYVWYAGAF